MNNIDLEKPLSWLDKALEVVEKYKIRTIFKAFGVLILISLFIATVRNPNWLFEKYDEWKEKEHTHKLEQRLETNHKIQDSIEKLLYKTDASRVMIVSLHNGLNDISQIPYLRGSVIYEALNEDIHPVSNQYQNVMLSLMPFSNYLYYNDYWCGDVEQLKTMDKMLYHRLSANGATHFCAVTIQGQDNPIGFIFLTYVDAPEHNCKDIKKQVQHTALEVALLLELKNK